MYKTKKSFYLNCQNFLNSFSTTSDYYQAISVLEEKMEFIIQKRKFWHLIPLGGKL